MSLFDYPQDKTGLSKEPAEYKDKKRRKTKLMKFFSQNIMMTA